jgi:hypothetical protein
VTASGREVGTMPLGEWVRVQIDIALGEGTPGTYQLTLRGPGLTAEPLELPYQNIAFREVHWLGISSSSEAASTFYIDNLRLGTDEELAQPPKRRPRARTAATQTHPRQIANDQGLAAYWTFDEDDPYTAPDHSGCGNDADIWTKRAQGAFGTALLCDPVAHSAIVKDAPTLQLGTGDFSIELWLCPTDLKIDSGDQRRRFMSKDRYPDSGWNLNVTVDGKPFIEMRDANRVTCANRPTGAIPENAWTHLVVVVDRAHAKTRYYYNGVLDSVQDIPAGFTGALDVEGRDLSLGSSWQPFIGLLDEVKIYRRALSLPEIQASYNQQRASRGSAVYEAVE